MRDLSCRPLSASHPADVASLQALLESAPGYYLVTQDRLPPPTAATDLFSAAPHGKSQADACVIGFFLAGDLVGCAGLVRGYPTREAAFLGLLLFAESHQGQGYGVAALAQIDAVARSWSCEKLRLAVIETNFRAQSFWRREGFVELAREPVAGFSGNAVVMERRLAG